MGKTYILHPDDFSRLPAPISDPPPPSTFGAIEVVSDRFAVLKPGEMLVMQAPIEHALLRHMAIEPEPDDRLVAFRYAMSMEFRIPKAPVLFGIDWGFDERPLRMRPRSWKEIFREQRRLDRSSNVRRRKRWAELAQRRGKAGRP